MLAKCYFLNFNVTWKVRDSLKMSMYCHTLVLKSSLRLRELLIDVDRSYTEWLAYIIKVDLYAQEINISTVYYTT